MNEEMPTEKPEPQPDPKGAVKLNDVLQNVVSHAVEKTYHKKKSPRMLLVRVSDKTQETIGINFTTELEPLVTKSLTKALAQRADLLDEYKTKWGWLTVNVDLIHHTIDVDLLDGVGTHTPIHLDWHGQQYTTTQTIVVPEPKRSFWKRLFRKS